MPLPSCPSIFQPTPFCPSSFLCRSNMNSFCVERYGWPQQSVGTRSLSVLLLPSFWCWSLVPLSFSYRLYVHTDALFLVVVSPLCWLKSRGSLLIPLVGLLLRQFVSRPQQFCRGITLVSQAYDLEVGISQKNLYALVAIAACMRRLPRNHRRFCPLFPWLLRPVSSPHTPPLKVVFHAVHFCWSSGSFNHSLVSVSYSPGWISDFSDTACIYSSCMTSFAYLDFFCPAFIALMNCGIPSALVKIVFISCGISTESTAWRPKQIRLDGQGVWGPWRSYKTYPGPLSPCTNSFQRLPLWSYCMPFPPFCRGRGHFACLRVFLWLDGLIFLLRPCWLFYRIVRWPAVLNTHPLSIYVLTYPLGEWPRRGYALK